MRLIYIYTSAHKANSCEFVNTKHSSGLNYNLHRKYRSAKCDCRLFNDSILPVVHFNAPKWMSIKVKISHRSCSCVSFTCMQNNQQSRKQTFLCRACYYCLQSAMFVATSSHIFSQWTHVRESYYRFTQNQYNCMKCNNWNVKAQFFFFCFFVNYYYYKNNIFHH